MKAEEINIGSSHHLLVHCRKVRHPAEGSDYFLLECRTRRSLRSLSLFSPYFLFPLSLFFSFFLSSFPPLFVLFQSHLVVFDSPGLACCDLFPSRIDPASISHHDGQIKIHADHSQVAVQRSEVTGSWTGSCSPVCVRACARTCVSGDNFGDGDPHQTSVCLLHKETNVLTYPNYTHHIHVADIILSFLL